MASSGEIGSLNQNYIKIESILLRATQTLRIEFRKRWKELSEDEWADSPENGAKVLVELRKRGFEWRGPAQINNINTGKVNNWDISILIKILLNFRKSNRASEEQEHLRKLKQVRNTFAHHSSKAVSDTEFKSLWNDVESALLFFGDTKAGIRDNTTKSLALLCSEPAIEINESNTKAAMKFVDRASKCCSEGKWRNAINFYSDAIMLSGLSDAYMAELYSKRSAAYLKQAETVEDKHAKASSLNKALVDGKSAVKHSPNCYKGFLHLGNIYKKLNQPQKALKNYESALALEPLQSEVKEARDACALSIGESARAEYFDAFSNQTVTREEQLQKFNEQTGLKIKMSRDTDESMSGGVPGYADVQKAHAYRHGVEEGVFQNYELAAQLYAKAAAVGNIEAMNNLGQMYMLGHGVKQDMKKAIHLYNEAVNTPEDAYSGAREEIAAAEFSLGFCYSEGIGVLKDECRAVKWYKQASEKGYSNATHNLASHYDEGRGVTKNFDKAVQYWKLAATSDKNALSMQSLALHYLRAERDPNEGRKWYKRSIQNGNYTAKLNEAKFEKEARIVQAKQARIVKAVDTWEQDNNLECTGMTFRQRVTRFMDQKNNPSIEMLKVMDTLNTMSIIQGQKQKRTPGSADTSPIDFDDEMLEQYAASGSVTAKRILQAIDHYEDAMGLYLFSEGESNTELLYHLAQAYKLETRVVHIPNEDKLELTERAKKCLDPVNSIEDRALDLNARICYIHLNMNSVQHILDFLTLCMKRYPNEAVFHAVASHLYYCLMRYEEGARTTSKSLEMFPTDFNLLYGRASHLSAQSNNHQLIIKAFEEYLTHAPIDDSHRPDAFYAIGVSYYEMSCQKVKPGKAPPTNILKAHEYYQSGLEAEKQQLPCFMPFNSIRKKSLENFLKLAKYILKKTEMAESRAEQLSDEFEAQIASVNAKQSPNIALLTDINRVKVIISFRTTLRSLAELSTLPIRAQFSAPPKNRRRRPQSLNGLTKITFNDMDPTTDHVYVNSILHVTSIEAALVGGASIGVLMQDSNLSVIRGAIYNFHTEDVGRIQKELGVGATMNIINPYMRQAMDGGFAIRVDDPKCLKLLSPSRENYCRFCGEQANSTCVRCGKAQYCSKECQANDWKIMKHKLICKK